MHYFLFSLLGTPTDEEWPQDSPVLSRSFHPRPPRNLELCVPGLDSEGVSLLERMLIFDHPRRISAHEAVRHPYFENRAIPEVEFPSMTPQTLYQQHHVSNLTSTAMPSSSATASSAALNVTSSSFGHYPDDSGYSSFIRDPDSSRK